MSKKIIISLLIFTSLMVCCISGCGKDSVSNADTPVVTNQILEGDEVTEYKTMEPPEDGWTIEELLSVTYLCNKQLSYPITVSSFSDGLELDMENIFYGINSCSTSLNYNGEYLGECLFQLDEELQSMPELIKSVSVDKINSEISHNVVINGIRIGCSRAEIERCFGTPSYIGDKAETYFIKYFDKNDDTKGMHFILDRNDTLIGVWIAS